MKNPFRFERWKLNVGRWALFLILFGTFHFPLSTFPGHAATVRYSARLSDGTPMTNTIVTLTEMFPITPQGSNYILGRPMVYRVLANGATNVLFTTGMVHYVIANFKSIIPPFDRSVTNVVPNDENTYDATSLNTVASTNAPGGLVAYSMTAADAQFLANSNWLAGSNYLFSISGGSGGSGALLIDDGGTELDYDE